MQATTWYFQKKSKRVISLNENNCDDGRKYRFFRSLSPTTYDIDGRLAGNQNLTLFRKRSCQFGVDSVSADVSGPENNVPDQSPSASHLTGNNALEFSFVHILFNIYPCTSVEQGLVSLRAHVNTTNVRRRNIMCHA